MSDHRAAGRHGPTLRAVPRAGAVEIPSPSEIASLVGERSFGTEYQPVVDLRSGATIGHEALSRFFDGAGRPVSPGRVFARLRDDPTILLHVEAETKRFQIEHAPRGPLFVNVDPDSFHAGSAAPRHVLLDAIEGHPPGVVVEVIETVSLRDVHRGRALVRALRERSIGVALDDVGAPETLLCLEALRDADIVKLDASWLGRIASPRDRAVLEALLALARRLGARTILEGVETEAQLRIAGSLGVDAVQGFLFRGRFRSRRAA
jgi:EAL domain-containing protein (putative c-di-GMP-specific phosphodiesterase class I)